MEEEINAVNYCVRDPESRRKGKHCDVNNLKLFPGSPVAICSSKGFHQVPMGEATKDKTILATPFGTFCYHKTPFGIRNTPAILQNLMDVVLRDCENFAATYINDNIIFSNEWSDHLEYTRNVLGKHKWRAS